MAKEAACERAKGWGRALEWVGPGEEGPITVRSSGVGSGQSQNRRGLWAGPGARSSLATPQIPTSFPLSFSEPTRKGMSQGKPRRSAQAPSRAAPGHPRGEEMPPLSVLPSCGLHNLRHTSCQRYLTGREDHSLVLYAELSIAPHLPHHKG